MPHIRLVSRLQFSTEDSVLSRQYNLKDEEGRRAETKILLFVGFVVEE